MLRLQRPLRPGSVATALVALALGIPAIAASDPIHGTWEQITPGAPTAPWRKYFVAIYDPLRERLVVDGRWLDYWGDTWALSLSGAPAWTELLHGSAHERAWHAGIHDAPRDRLLIFGWTDGYPFGYYNQLRTLPLYGTPAWSVLSPAGTVPAGRVRHTAIYDPVRDRMVVFGGDLWGIGPVNEVWELALAGTPTWTQLLPSGGPPSARISHTAIYDPIRDVMLVFGGTTATGPTNDVWQLSLSGPPAWTQIAAVGTPPDGRSRHSSIYDPVRDRMVVFGGYATGNVQMNDVWALSLAGTPTWSPLAPLGTPPAAREGHKAIYDPPRDRMVICGGGPYPADDVWALSWASVVAVEPPPGGPAPLALQARPNPAVTEVTVEFSLPRESTVSLRLYDVRGRSVRLLAEGPLPAGPHRVRWDRITDDGARAVSGVYFLHLRSAAGRLTRRFLLLD